MRRRPPKTERNIARLPQHPSPAIAPEAREPLRDATHFIFDVEGTLVDTVMPTLCCWRGTLEEFGYTVTLADLHRYSGMDGNDMLDKVLPRPVSSSVKKEMLERQDKRYREEYLSTVHTLPGVKALFEALKKSGCRIALATDCKKDELERYLTVTDVRELVDAIACGSDVKHGKPHPDLVQAALRRLKVRKNHVCILVGDTPFDADAARTSGITAIGMLSGHFPALDLLTAGCIATFRDPRALHQAFTEARTELEAYAEAS